MKPIKEKKRDTWEKSSMKQAEINKVPKSQWIKLFNQRQKRKKAASSVQKTLYKRPILHLEICMGSQGMRGNGRKIAGMLTLCYHFHSSNNGKVSAKAFNKDWKQWGKGKEGKCPNYQITDTEENSSAWWHDLQRKHKTEEKKNLADSVNIQNR